MVIMNDLPPPPQSIRVRANSPPLTTASLLRVSSAAQAPAGQNIVVATSSGQGTPLSQSNRSNILYSDVASRQVTTTTTTTRCLLSLDI